MNMKVNKNPRIDIPSSPSDAIDLVGSIKTQHDELGKDSPLVVLDWATHGPVIKEATEVNKQIKELTRQVEQLTQRRVALTEPVLDFIRSSRDVLAGAHRSELRKLSDFGFEVDDTPRAKKPANASGKKVSA